MASSQKSWMSKEDYKKKKELEEARKAGTVPPEMDEEGKIINPHIPQYISRVPWYVPTTGPTLKHQRKPNETTQVEPINSWYKRGARLGPAATKYRKGACENCGAMTHTAKDCTDRPRRKGAKWTGKDIKADEILQDLSLDFEGKRDRWNGYDPEMYQEVLDKYSKTEVERRKYMSKELQSSLTGEDEAKQDALLDEENAVVMAAAPDSRNKTLIKNLRIREDTAKYLLNLDPESAYYDPKTRSMRANPLEGKDADEVLFAGENALRYTGEAADFLKMQVEAFHAYEQGHDVHLQATPSLAETLHRTYNKRKEEAVKSRKDEVLKKYGGEEYLDSLPPELVHAQTEEYVEYSIDGKVVKGKPRAVAKSRYEEDVYINNHTSVWGSYWTAGKWGYACCKQLEKKTYCLGEKGAAIANAAPELSAADPLAARLSETAAINELLRQKIAQKEAELKRKQAALEEDSDSSSSSSSGSDSDGHKRKKKKRGHKKKRRHSSSSESSSSDEEVRSKGRKRRRGEDEEVDEEDMEEFHRRKARWADPMKDYVDNPTL